MIDWDYALRCLPELGRGLLVTVQATFAGMALALVLGLLWVVPAYARVPLLGRAARGLGAFVRGTPLLVQLYLLFYVLPGWGVRLSPLATGVLGLGVHYGAYLCEVYRAGIAAVPRGQWEAAAVLGLSRARTFGAVIVPQALPPMLPAIGNYLLAMFKDTPVLSAITVLEMLQRAKLLGAAEFRYLEPLLLVGVAFLLISVPAARVMRALEVRLARA